MIWNEFPGCCGIAVIYDLEAAEYDYRTNRYERLTTEAVEGNLALNEQEVADEGYTMALATTVPSQRFAIKALQKRGWRSIKWFKSKRTRNRIYIWWKKIK